MKHLSLFFSFLLIVFAFTSCHKGEKVTPHNGIKLTLDATDLQQAAADNSFTFNLFKTVAAGDANGSNLFLSPLSVSMALGMTTNGANGQTLTDMQNTLGFSGFSQDQTNNYFNKLVTQLPELDPNTTLKIANSIWYRQGFSVLPAFLQTNTTNFNANIQALDFSNPASVNTINNWVSNATNGKITQMVGQISPDDVMYLVNAIYFKSIWASKFDASNTAPMLFTRADNTYVQASFMNGKINTNIYRGADVTLVELPYSNQKYSMVIAMPAGGKSVSDIMQELNADTWKTWADQLSPYSVEVHMPKFQYSYSTSLNGPLSAMGMEVAFSKQADFSRINATMPLQITSVKHKAYVAVDESGTTAAAATTVTVGDSAAPLDEITIDHPFIFVIREMSTGLVLFTGVVNDPTQNGL